MIGLIKICFSTEDLLDKTNVASKVQRNLINIGLGFGLEVLYFTRCNQTKVESIFMESFFS